MVCVRCEPSTFIHAAYHVDMSKLSSEIQIQFPGQELYRSATTGSCDAKMEAATAQADVSSRSRLPKNLQH